MPMGACARGGVANSLAVVGLARRPYSARLRPRAWRRRRSWQGCRSVPALPWPEAPEPRHEASQVLLPRVQPQGPSPTTTVASAVPEVRQGHGAGSRARTAAPALRQVPRGRESRRSQAASRLGSAGRRTEMPDLRISVYSPVQQDGQEVLLPSVRRQVARKD